jgi:hypothetical protein
MPNLKLSLEGDEQNETMKVLAFILLQGLHLKLDNKSYFFHRKILEMFIFLDLLLKFRHFVDNESYNEATCSLKRLNPYWIT